MDSAGVGEWFRQLFHLDTPLDATRRGICPVATFTDPETGLATAVTCGFSDFDVGLRAAPPVQATSGIYSADVRVELLCQASPGYADQVPSAVAAAAVALLAHPDHLTPQPGTILPNLAESISGWRGQTVHGLLASPALWQDGVPHLWEENEEAAGGTGRLTVPLQLLMLTGEEYAHGVTYSFDTLMEDMVAQHYACEAWGRSQ